VAELADAQDLGFCAARRTGSSPVFPTLHHEVKPLDKDSKLKIETQPRDDHQVTMTVELEHEQMDSAKHRAARQLSGRKSIPGFRPGKAPYDVVVRSFGENVITEEAVDLLLEDVYPKALKEANLEPGASGSLEKVENLDSKPKFIFTVPLAPSVTLGDYRSIRLTYDWKEPGEDKVDESLEELRQMHAKTETVDRPIQKGDFVMVDLKGVKATALQGESPLMERQSLPIFIRKDEKPEEFPFPGFSNELIGLKTGEIKSFSHKYKKSEKDETLKGQKVQFDLTVKMVRSSILPDLNDEFAKQAGPFENLQALRQAVKANLETESKAQYDDKYFDELMGKIKDGAIIKYPPQVVDHEVEHVMDDLKSRLAGQNIDMTAYLKSREMDEEKFVSEEARPIAIRRLERSLVMDEIAKLEKIEVSQEMLQSSFQQTWGEYQDDSDFKKMTRGKSQPPKQVMNAVAMESANRAYVQLTLNRLREIATGQAPLLAQDMESSGEDSLEKVGRNTKITTKKTTSKKNDAIKRPANKKTTSSETSAKELNSTDLVSEGIPTDGAFLEENMTNGKE
jgi:trigger factor